MKILFVNACVREESRTRKLARYLLEKLDGQVEEVDLNKEKLLPLDRERLSKRMEMQSRGDYSDAIFDKARQFAEADTIVIAAPYWDLSFPALLKTYFELICAIGVTFAYNEQEMPYSLCHCTRLIYVTSAGGKIISDEFGFGYAAALMRTFFGVSRADQIKVQGLDLLGADPEQIMREAYAEIDSYISREW